MSSIIVDIADGVVDLLNAGAFSESFTARRTWQLNQKLSDMEELSVTVIVPKEAEISNADRGSSWWDCTFQVGFQQKIAGEPVARDERCDQLAELMQEAFDWMARNRPVDGAAFVEMKLLIQAAPDHLEKNHAFTGVMTFTYRVRR